MILTILKVELVLSIGLVIIGLRYPPPKIGLEAKLGGLFFVAGMIVIAILDPQGLFR